MALPFLLALLLGSAALPAGFFFVRHRRVRGRRLYQQSLERALADGILTEEEARELKTVREERDLSEAEVRMVALSLYRRALQQAVADSRITAEENQELQSLREHLGLSDHDLRNDVAQLRRVCVLSEIERGKLPHVESPVALANGEECHWVMQARLAERLAAPGRKSQLESLEFAVDGTEPFSASGARADLGSSGEILPVDLGVLVVTSRRTLFRGARRTVAVPHIKLRTLDLFSDGLAIEEADPLRRTFFIVDDPELTSAVLLNAARNRRRDLSGLTTRTA